VAENERQPKGHAKLQHNGASLIYHLKHTPLPFKPFYAYRRFTPVSGKKGCTKKGM
jgi:hypothetical protein